MIQASLSNATNQQLKVIFEEDGHCPIPLLSQVIEEVISRDLYKGYIIRIVNSRFKSIKYAEYILGQTLEDIKSILYFEMINALKFFKQGKNGFIGFWANFMQSKLKDMSRDSEAAVRKINHYLDPIEDDEGKVIVIEDVTNVEKKVIQMLEVESVFKHLNEKEITVVKLRSEGYTDREIGEKLNVSRQFITAIRKKLKYQFRGIA